MTPTQRVKCVRHAMITALVLGLIFIGISKGVFWLLNIRTSDFLFAGGIILLVLAVRYLMTGELVEFPTMLGGEMIRVVPIGTPLVVGPAVLTTLLLLSDRFALCIPMVAIVLDLLLASLVLCQGNRVARLLRREGVGAISQIGSLLLAAIAVMMTQQGLVEILGL